MSTYLRVLRHRDFRYLFLGQSASAVGDQVVVVALALYITQRTGSPTDLGLVLAAQSVPMVALLLFGGVWADRLPRHRIMIVTDLVRALLHAVLAALILTGGASVGEMVVIEALFGAARAFFQPAYTGLLPQTIREERKQDAWALSDDQANLAILVGPALGTALVLGARRRVGVRASTRPRSCSAPCCWPACAPRSRAAMPPRPPADAGRAARRLQGGRLATVGRGHDRGFRRGHAQLLRAVLRPGARDRA